MKIKDKFTNLKVSKERKHQLRHPGSLSKAKAKYEKHIFSIHRHYCPIHGTTANTDIEKAYSDGQLAAIISNSATLKAQGVTEYRSDLIKRVEKMIRKEKKNEYEKGYEDIGYWVLHALDEVLDILKEV